MNIYYKDLSAKDFQTKLEDEIDKDFNNALGIDLGHTEELHHDQTTSQMLSRAAAENRSTISSFYDTEVMEDAISNAAYFAAKDITKWIQSRPNEFAGPRDYQEYAVSLVIDDTEMISKGYKEENGVFKEIETPAIRLVLQREIEAPTEFGFYIKTAYGDLNHPLSKYTGVEYTRDDIVNNRMIDFPTNMHRIAFQYANAESNIRISVVDDPCTGEQQLKVSNYQNPDIKLISYIKQDGQIDSISYSDTGRSRVSEEWLPKDYAKFLDGLSQEIERGEIEAANIIDDIQEAENLIDTPEYTVSHDWER